LSTGLIKNWKNNNIPWEYSNLETTWLTNNGWLGIKSKAGVHFSPLEHLAKQKERDKYLDLEKSIRKHENVLGR
jgi:hypothetical protein